MIRAVCHDYSPGRKQVLGTSFWSLPCLGKLRGHGDFEALVPCTLGFYLAYPSPFHPLSEQKQTSGVVSGSEKPGVGMWGGSPWMSVPLLIFQVDSACSLTATPAVATR